MDRGDLFFLGRNALRQPDTQSNRRKAVETFHDEGLRPEK